jgi:hypothetical protein
MAMSAPELTLHQEPRRPAEQLHESFFALFGGPLAWLMQLCLGYALASEPCFPGAERRVALPAHLMWTRGAIALAMIAACVIALLACASSVRSYRRSSLEMQRDVRHVVRVGAERTCFLALWGVIFSAGFALASVLTFLAYFMLPRCAG